MKPLSFREVKRKLLKAGFVVVDQTGSHVKFAKITDLGTLTAMVPTSRDCGRDFAKYSEAGGNFRK